MKLSLGGYDLIRQVVGTTERDRGINQFARPLVDGFAIGVRCALLVVKDEREYFRSRPSEESSGIGQCVPD